LVVRDLGFQFGNFLGVLPTKKRKTRLGSIAEKKKKKKKKNNNRQPTTHLLSWTSSACLFFFPPMVVERYSDLGERREKDTLLVGDDDGKAQCTCTFFLDCEQAKGVCVDENPIA